MASAVSACFAAPILVGLVASRASAQSTYTITPDETRVLFFEDQDSDGVKELYSVPIDGSQAPQMLALARGAGVYFYAYATASPDSSMALFFAAQTGTSERVHGVPADGSAGSFEYPFPAPGISKGDTDPWFEISPLGGRVLYWNEGASLHSAPIDSGSSVLLSGGATAVFGGAITPDDARVVFRSNEMYPGFVFPRLFVSALDGSTGPTPLRGTITSGTVVFFQLSPGGATVAYIANQDAPALVELYSVPSDASALPVKLNPPLVAGGQVYFDFAITPDDERVVYRAEQDVDGVIEIYSVPLDGSGSSVQLNGPLVTGGGVSQQFQISSDGGLVVYLADERTNDVVELFSRAIAGGGPGRCISGELVPGGDVTHCAISASGRQVVFRADKLADDDFGLFSVWIGGPFPHARPFPRGPWPLVQLNGPLVAGGDVIESKISPDGRRVVYRADEEVNDTTELYSVPIGGGGAIKLNSALPSGDDVLTFQIGAGRVVYGASGEIYSVPIDASEPPVQLTF